jgi:hypothetical protein
MTLTLDALDDLRAALRDNAADLAVHFFGKPNPTSNKRELRFRTKGSVSVPIAGTKVGTWFDFEAGVGGDMFDLIIRECGGGFSEAAAYARDFVGSAITPARPAPLPVENRGDGQSSTVQFASQLWSESVDPRGTLVEIYLASRGLDIPNDVGKAVIRYHAPFHCLDRTAAAMVALFRNIGTNEPAAISATFLNERAEKIERRFFGPVGNAAVKLDADENVTEGLHVCEGVETGIAAHLAGYRPVWALGSSGAIKKFPVLGGIDALTILTEQNDGGANARAVAEVAQRWHDADREALSIEMLVGDDMNDAWREAAQ